MAILDIHKLAEEVATLKEQVRILLLQDNPIRVDDIRSEIIINLENEYGRNDPENNPFDRITGRMLREALKFLSTSDTAFKTVPYLKTTKEFIPADKFFKAKRYLMDSRSGNHYTVESIRLLDNIEDGEPFSDNELSIAVDVVYFGKIRDTVVVKVNDLCRLMSNFVLDAVIPRYIAFTNALIETAIDLGILIRPNETADEDYVRYTSEYIKPAFAIGHVVCAHHALAIFKSNDIRGYLEASAHILKIQNEIIGYTKELEIPANE